MELRYRLAGLLMATALLAGCAAGAPGPTSAKGPVSAPTVPATPSPKPAEQPVLATPAPAQQTLTFTTVQQGAYSGVVEKKAVLMTDEAGWKANWQQLSARQVPPPAAPQMDFSGQDVLAVYMGEQRTGGHSIEITGVELVNGTLKVTVRQNRPGPGAITTQALTQPFHMVRIPKVPAGTKVEVNW